MNFAYATINIFNLHINRFLQFGFESHLRSSHLKRCLSEGYYEEAKDKAERKVNAIHLIGS
jgi:hypothetical protein